MPPVKTGCCRETGRVFPPVAHEGDTQASEGEVGAIAEVAAKLVERRFIARDGGRRPLQLENILLLVLP